MTKDKTNVFGLIIFVCLIIFIMSGLSYNLGKKFGENIGESKACQLNTTYVPPMYCYEITHNTDGYRCCNWNGTMLQCGRPLLQIR